MLGFIVQLDSSSFPGLKCYFFKRDPMRAWCNHTEREMAHVFTTREAAEIAVKQTWRSIRYAAPELHGNLGVRLKEAQILPV